jgi:hypothetical protein
VTLGYSAGGFLNAEPGTASLEVLKVFNLVLGSGADSEEQCPNVSKMVGFWRGNKYLEYRST